MDQTSSRFKKTSDERRADIRVQDAVALTLQKLESGETPSYKLKHSKNQKLDFERQINAGKSGFEGLADLRVENPDAAAYIELLENKLGLNNEERSSSNEILTQPTHKVSLSGSGIAFSHDQLLQPGDRVELNLILFPSNEKVGCVVTLVSVGGDSGLTCGGPHTARAVFSDIDAVTRTIVLKHIDYLLSKM